jgi:hypothetical protein
LVLSSSAGGSVIGNFLSAIGFVLIALGFFILVSKSVQKMIGGRSKPFIVAIACMALGILLMIVGYYFLLIIRPFIS